MQYITDVRQTINFFVDNAYFLYVHWLNPGHHDQNEMPHVDYLGITTHILSLDSTLNMRNGKQNLKSREQEIKVYLYGWAFSRNLIIKDID